MDVSVCQHSLPKRLERAPPRSRDTPTAAIPHLGPEAHVYQQRAGQRWLFSSFPLPAGSACAARSRREKDAHGVREPGEGWGGGSAGAVEAAGGIRCRWPQPEGCGGAALGRGAPLSSRVVAFVPQAGRLPVKMSYMLPHLHNGWQVDQAILSEEDRVVVIRFGHDWDPTCMKMDEVLYSIAEKVNPQLHRGGV